MDKLIYCNDLVSLKTKLKEDGYYNEESGVYSVGNQTITPLKYNGNTSLSYVRDFALSLDEYTMLEDLGNYKSILLAENSDKLYKYKSVYDYETPVEYIDENGDVQIYMKPFKIGDFA